MCVKICFNFLAGLELNVQLGESARANLAKALCIPELHRFYFRNCSCLPEINPHLLRLSFPSEESPHPKVLLQPTDFVCSSTVGEELSGVAADKT
jgi:hypothetical protein